ncbi:MAG: flagellar filament capping protein FliD, partial [Natronospirillum sp.]
MASIESLGIGSGLLTTELVDNIIAAEREGTDLRLDRREAKVEAQITAYGEVKSVISQLQSASAALADVNTLRETQANSSNEAAVTATTNQLAEVGTYRINVDSVAESQTVASQRFNAPTDTIGTGSLTFDFGEFEFDGDENITGFTQSDDGNSFTLDLTSGNNTLSGVRDAINGLDAGIQASLVNDGEGYRLLFSSTETGADNGFSVSVTGDAGLQGLAFNAAQNDPDANMVLTQKAQDASVSINGLQITSASNELTEVARGVTINLKDATNGSTVSLSVTRDPSVMVERTEAFIEAYNEYKDLHDELTAFSPDSAQGGLLIGDSALRQVETQVRRSLTQLVEGLENSKYRTLADIGIFTDRHDDFKLALDTNTLTTAFQSSIDDVTGLFATQTTASDSLINYIAKGADTEPGDYDINITQLATQGKFEGRSISGFADYGEVVISGSNDNFRINVDGTAADVTLTQGTYTDPDQLALMIQNSINNTSALQDRGRSVSVGFDPVSQSMDITSSRFGSQSQVFFENADP